MNFGLIESAVIMDIMNNEIEVILREHLMIIVKEATFIITMYNKCCTYGYFSFLPFL